MADRQRSEYSRFCPACGSGVGSGKRYCGSCGAEVAGTSAETHEGRIGQRGYEVGSLGLALVSLALVPVVFGPLAIFCGLQVFRRFSERRGLALMAVAGVCMVAGMLLGAAANTGTL